MPMQNKSRTIYYALSDKEIEELKHRLKNAFEQFNINSEILNCQKHESGLKIDISVPDGMKIKTLLSYQDDIDIRLPNVTIEMEPDFLRAVIVIFAHYRSEEIKEEPNRGITLDDTNGVDDKLMDATDVVIEAGMASTTLLQRKLNLGYARAARLIDELEERKIVGPFEGSKPRKVLVTKKQWAEMRAQLPKSVPSLDKEPQDDDFE